MIKDYPHAEINEGAESARRSRKGVRAEIARSLATRPLLGVAACFALGLLVGGGVTVGAVKATDDLRNGRRKSSDPAPEPIPQLVLFPEVISKPDSRRTGRTARLFRFPVKRGED